MQIFRRIFSDLYRRGHQMRKEELLLFLQKIKVLHVKGYKQNGIDTAIKSILLINSKENIFVLNLYLEMQFSSMQMTLLLFPLVY